MKTIGRRVRGLVAILIATLIGLAGAQPAWSGPPEQAQRHLTVATYNLYLGADLTPLFTASRPEELVQRAAAVYAQVVRTDFPSRAEAIARQLAENPPEVVGLQEVALWETSPIGGSFTTSYDFLDLVLDALAKEGLTYERVAVNTNFTGSLPISAATAVKFTDRDVVIARSDLPASHLTVSNAESHNFDAVLMFPSPIPGLIFVAPRGWSTVDVKVRGKTVRVANTHLEAFNAAVRNAQAAQLIGVLSRSTHPVVVLGDLNSPPSDRTGAYGAFLAAGYADAWVRVHGSAPGLTCCQAEDLRNVPSLLDQRIDYVLYTRRGIDAVAAEVIGEELDDRTPAGLWPSDHAGVVATLHVSFP